MKNYIIIQSLSKIWQTIKPESRIEQCVFLLLLLYFAAIAATFCLIALPKGLPLGMLGYDTAGHLTYEPMMISSENILNWNLRHPLYRLFFLPVILINEGLLLLNIHITWPLFLATSTFYMSCSGLFIFKTLQALHLSNAEASLLLLLFCSFAHIIMLSIQVDSFVMSMFFCSGMTLFYVRHVHNILSDNLLFLGITGTTSTNFIKFAIYQLLEEKSIKQFFFRFCKSIIFFCILFIFTFPNLVTRIIERPRGFLYAVMGDSFYFQGSDISKWQLFIDNFLSDPLLFHHTTGILYSYETIHLPTYPSLWCNLPIAIIFLQVITSVVLNINNRLIHMFCCCFGFDLLMHFGIGYGIEEGQLFCGHWLFFVPIIIALLFTNTYRFRKSLLYLIIISSIFFYYFNIFHFFNSLFVS